MKEEKARRLREKGWRVGSAREFLNLDEAEEAYIEARLALSDLVREMRAARRLTQHELAAHIKSSQSRVAKVEAGDPSVSIDLELRSALALGASLDDVARALQRRGRRKASSAER